MRLLAYTDEPVASAGLGQLFEGSDIHLFCVCNNLDEFASKAQSESPEVGLLDTTPALTFARIGFLRHLAPSMKLVVWTRNISPELAHNLLEAGITGILRKNLSTDLIHLCLTKVHAGEIWMERELVGSLLRARTVSLSPRERQLLKLISCGLSNKQIATELFLSEGTIKVYLSRLFRKAGVRDRFELAIYGIRHCNFSPDSGLSQGKLDESAWPSSMLLAEQREKDIA